MRTLKFLTLFIFLAFMNNALARVNMDQGEKVNEANIHYTENEYIDLMDFPRMSEIKKGVFCWLTVEESDFVELKYGYEIKRGYAWVLNKKKHIEKQEFKTNTSQISREEALEIETQFIKKFKKEVPRCEELE